MNKRKNHKIRVGITMGDPSGIGPAVIAKTLIKLADYAQIKVIGDARVLKKAGLRDGLQHPAVEIIDLKNVLMAGFAFGRIRAEYGRAAIEYIDRALELLADKELDCLVTAPISKEAASLSGFRYPGHTEYLASRAGIRDYAMLLLNKNMRLIPVTRHIPLARVPRELSKELIFKNICLAHKGMKFMFGIPRPRIIVCGLNPHASDNGLIGNEEFRIIWPALKKARNTLGIVVDGPISADVAISKAAAGEYDCVIAMYHDQAMIPLKLSGNDSGVNMTLGLPFVRTSPLHGTAFDIASKFKLADPASFIAASLTAIRCAQNQRND